MAASIISSITKNQSFKLYDSNNNSVLSGIHITRVRIKLAAKLLRNQLEDGSSYIDSKILLPVTVTVTMIAESQDALEKINSLFLDISGSYTLYSRGIYITHLTNSSQKIHQGSEMLSATPIEMSFSAIMRENEDYPVSAQAGDSDTIIGGIINTITTTVSDAYDKITTLANNIL